MEDTKPDQAGTEAMTGYIEFDKSAPPFAEFHGVESAPMKRSREPNRLQLFLWEIGNRCFGHGCYHERTRPFWWMLGRFFVRHSRIDWDWLCDTVDD